MMIGRICVLVTFSYFFMSIDVVKSQILRSGECPTIPLREDLDVDQVAGQWFELERFYFDPEINTRCATVEFRPSLSGDRVDSFHISLDDKTNLIQIAKGSANVQNSTQIGEFSVEFPSHREILGNEKVNYYILDTDYTSFTILWSCSSLCTKHHTEMLWLLGRSPNMLSSLRTRLYSRLHSLGMETRSLIPVSHKYCTFSAMQPVSMYKTMSMGANSLGHFLVRRHVSGGSVAEPPVKEVKFHDLQKMLEANNVTLIDVREPKELSTDGKIPGSYNIPLGDVEKAFQLPPDKFQAQYNFPLPDKHDANLIFSCKSGRRATIAVQAVHRLGFLDARCYCGSFLDWVEKGGKVEKP